MPRGYRSPGLVEAAVCSVKPFGPVPTQLVYVAVLSLLLVFADFNGAAVFLRWAICLMIMGITYVLSAWRAIITFDEARMRVTVQRALLPFRGRARAFDLLAAADARLVTDGGKVRFEILNERRIVVDAIVVYRLDAKAVAFVERVVAAVGREDDEEP